MLKHKSRFRFLVMALICVSSSKSLQASPHETLICSVDGSNDEFNVYPNQQIYSSDSFLHYQMISGLTVLVVNRQTMKFNRLSNLNLLQNSTLDPRKQPEKIQLFNGSCKAVNDESL